MQYNSLMVMNENLNNGDLITMSIMGGMCAMGANSGAVGEHIAIKERKKKLRELIMRHAKQLHIHLTGHKSITFKAIDIRDKDIDAFALFDAPYSVRNKDMIHSGLRTLCQRVNDEATSFINDVSIHDNAKDSRFVLVFSGNPVSRIWMKSHT